MDRGKEAVEMQDFILELMRKEEVILIRGNHEDLFRDFLLLDDCRYMEPHVSNGTYGTALQLSRFDMTQAMIMPDTFAKRLTRTPYFETIMPAMGNSLRPASTYSFTDGYRHSVRDGISTVLSPTGGAHPWKNGKRPDGTMAWMLSEHLARKRPLFVDTGTHHMGTTCSKNAAPSLV